MSINRNSEYPPGFEDNFNNIAIDFDGVIHTYDKGYYDGTCYGEPIEGAKKALESLALKFKIIIFTAKAKPNRPLVNGKTGKQLVEEWLEKYGMLQYVTEVTAEKPRACLYIDDKGYRFQDWGRTIDFINQNIK